MKKNSLFQMMTLSLVALAMSLTVACGQGALGEDLVVTLDKPGEVGTLRIELVYGSISVTAHDGKEVIITPKKSAAGNGSCDCDEDSNTSHNHNSNTNDGETTSRSGLTRINTGTNYKVTVNQSNNVVTLSTESWKSPLDFEVKVPRNFNLRLKTVNDGKITIRGISGNHEIGNVNGPITLVDVRGSLVANTVNGDITANFLSINKEVPMAFNTLNGNIDLRLPDNAAFNVKLQTNRGDVLTDFEFEPIARQPKVERTGEGSTQQIRLEDWTYGKINGGGPEYIFKSFHGDILIRKSE